MVFLETKQSAVLAQPVERMAFNHVVVGSIPTDGVFQFIFYLFFFGPYHSRPISLITRPYLLLFLFFFLLKKKNPIFCFLFLKAYSMN